MCHCLTFSVEILPCGAPGVSSGGGGGSGEVDKDRVEETSHFKGEWKIRSNKPNEKNIEMPLPC